MAKNIVLALLSIVAVASIGYGKYKLATASMTWWVIVLGAIVFAMSNTTKAATATLTQENP
jgi:hypothetical protein